MPNSEFRIDCRYLCFDIKEVERVLAGGIHRLFYAFAWVETREGGKFWADQFRAKELPPAGRKSLEEMVAMHKAQRPWIIDALCRFKRWVVRTKFLNSIAKIKWN